MKTRSVNHLKEILLLIGLAILYFVYYFRPFTNSFPLPRYNPSLFFNKSLPAYQLYTSELKQNRLPTWNKFSALGSSPLTQRDNNATSPLTLILCRLADFPRNLKFVYLMAITCGLTGMYFFLIQIINSRKIAIYGSILYSFSGHYISNASNAPQIQIISLLPLICFLAKRVYEKRTAANSFLLSLLFAIQIFSGAIDFSLITLLICLLVTPFTNTKKITIPHMLTIVFSWIVGLFLSAAKLLPYLNLNDIIVYPTAFYFKSSLSPDSLFSLVNLYADTKFSIFVGIIPVFVILRHLITKSEKRQTLFFISIILALVSSLMLIPSRSPLYILYLFPPFNLISDITIFGSILTFFLVIASAIGLEALTNSRKSIIRYFGKALIVISLAEILIFSKNSLPTKSSNDIINELTPFGPTQSRVWHIITTQSANNLFQVGENSIFWNTYSFDTKEETSKRYKTYANAIVDRMELDREKKEITFTSGGLKLLQTLGINYVVSSEKINNLKETQKEGALTKYIVQNPVADIREAATQRTAKTQQEIIDTIASENFDPRSSVVLEKDIIYPKMTIVSQGYQPGLQLKLDGAGKQINGIPANLNQTMFPVSKEAIERGTIIFWPESLKNGIFVSIATFFLGIIYIFYRKLKILQASFF